LIIPLRDKKDLNTQARHYENFLNREQDKFKLNVTFSVDFLALAQTIL
tara:strand:+ start:1427 stop:1570 length:144 start_codon:yes stop_codon:yes gene_type:complete